MYLRPISGAETLARSQPLTEENTESSFYVLEELELKKNSLKNTTKMI